MANVLSLRLLWEWLKALKVGDPVLVRWTNSFNQWETEAKVTKINPSSVRIEITKPIVDGDKTIYPAGQSFPVTLPKGRAISRWSWNNTILPIDKQVITETVPDSMIDKK